MASRKSTPDILDKRIPRNPKYENVKPTIDTGSSMPKYLAKMEASGKLKDRSGELFKRIKPKQLANTILCEFHLLPQEASHTLANVPATVFNSSPSTPSTPTQTNTTTMVGTSLHPGDAPPSPARPSVTPGQSSILLLDVREPEEYEVARIKGAISYPAAILSRAINYFTSDLYYYKNKENKTIVIYDEDEKVAVQAGNTFFQKGIDNIVMLTGGLREMYEEFPDLVVGILPPKPGTPGSSRKSSSRDSDRSSATGSVSSMKSARSTASKTSSASRLSTTSIKTKTVDPNAEKPWK